MSDIPVDRGYSWVILAACCVIYMLISGINKSYGILYAEFLRQYGSGAGVTAWIGSVQMFLFFGMGPIANYLSQRFTFKAVIMLGGFTSGLAFFLSAFVNRLEWMYLTMGVMAGFGFGLIFAPCTTVVNFYFKKWRALANGIVISGSGIGSVTCPYLYRLLIDSYGFRGALVITSGILLNVCVAASLLRQPQQLHVHQKQTKSKGIQKQIVTEEEDQNLLNIKHNTRTRNCKFFIFDFSLFKLPLYTTYILSFTINIIGFSANFTVFPTHMESLGFSLKQVAIALSMIGAAEIFARAFFGWFADMKIIKKRYILIFAAFVSGTVAILIPLFREFPAMIVYGCVIGTFPGAFWSMMAVILLDCVELERLPSAFGIMSFCFAFGCIVSQTLAGWIKDLTGTWDGSFRFIGTCNILAGIILVAQPLINRFWCCSNIDKNTNDKSKITSNIDGLELTVKGVSYGKDSLVSNNLSTGENSIQVPLVSISDI